MMNGRVHMNNLNTVEIMLIPCNILLEEMQTWPSVEVEQIKKKLNMKKSTEHVQLLQVHKFFMPGHLHRLLRRCGFQEEASILEKESDNCDEPTHESYCLHNDNLVKNLVKSKQNNLGSS